MNQVFRPTNAEFLANPYPFYKTLRETSPIFFYEPWQKYVLMAYEDVNRLLRDKRLGRVSHNDTLEDIQSRPTENERRFERSRIGSLLEIEPPDHTRIKDVFHAAFTPKRVRALGEKVALLCDDLVTKLLAKDKHEADLIADFAQPIPVTVIADLLGIPEADRHQLVPWSSGIIGWFEPYRTAEMEAEAVRCAEGFMDYLKNLITVRRKSLGDDLLSAMISVHDENPEKLSELELINNCILLLNAGHEAVVNVIGNGMYALLRHKEQWQALKQNHDLIPTAIEEMMRFDTPLQFFERVTHEDIHYKGFDWPKGTTLCLYYSSANHDPAMFEAPEQFDISRNPNPHIAFGLGLHYCIGAPLARVELQAALKALATRLPKLELVETPEYLPKNVFRYLTELKVKY